MQTIDIPNFKKLTLKHIVLDYNGTIAKDGILKKELHTLLPQLSEVYKVHVITADTFGTVHEQLAGFDVTVKCLESKNHTQEKADYLFTLGQSTCAAVGNGNNDAKMLKLAPVSVAIIGDEGCCTSTMLLSNVIVHSITDALELFLFPKRLIATLRA